MDLHSALWSIEKSDMSQGRRENSILLLFWAAGCEWFNITWFFLTRVNVLCLVWLICIVLHSGAVRTTWSYSLIVYVWHPWYLHWKATKKRQIWEGDAANRLGRRPKWGGAHWAVGVESGWPTDPSTHGAVCNTSWWERGKKLHQQSSFADTNLALSLYSKCKGLHKRIYTRTMSNWEGK